MKITDKELSQGKLKTVPWYYGFCYRDHPLETTCLYPIPLNHIIRSWITFLYKRKLRKICWPDTREGLDSEYRRGESNGYYAGFCDGQMEFRNRVPKDKQWRASSM